MKLIIQIPCLDEEKTLPETVADFPREIEGIDEIEFLVIDDGSTDRTVEVAREIGVHHVAVLPRNQGLAAAFSTGLEVAVGLGADIVVNTDGDNQYFGADIAKLVAPVVAGDADIVIGDRQTQTIPHFSRMKKRLQRFGSFVVRRFSGTTVPDATSGFRAMTREAALRLNIVSSFSYTLESIIQAAKKGLRIISVPVGTNPKTRESRLMRSTPEFVVKSAVTILRISVFYRPFRFFLYIGLTALFGGALLGVRFLIYFLSNSGDGHIQSLILAAVLLMLGFTTLTLGVLSDLIAVNRRLLEDQAYRQKLARLDRGDFRLDRSLGIRLLSAE